MSKRTRSIPLLLSGLALGASTDDPSSSWLSLPVPGVERIDRADMDLAGEAEPGGPLVDGLANGSRSWTAMGLRYQADRGRTDDRDWSRRLSAFDLQAVLGGEGGLSFGMNALDVQPTTTVRSGAVEGKMEEPLGGLRLGLGADALRPVRRDRDWTLALATWIPVYSNSLDWEVQAALVHRRRLRLDLSWAWGEPETPANIERAVDDSTTWSDTLRWRTRRMRLSGRVGFAPAEGVALQAWGGRRILRDPGSGDPGWRLSGHSWFGGVQAAGRLGESGLEGEFRFDQGSERGTFDTAEGTGWTSPSETVEQAEHDLCNGRLEWRGPWIGSGPRTRMQFLAGAQGAWLQVRGRGPQAGTVPWSGSGTWGEERRHEVHSGVLAALPWLSVEATLGAQRREVLGDPEASFWVLAVPGCAWSLPWSLRAFREGEGGSAVSYRISGEIPAGGSRALRPGLRHEFRVGQQF